MFLRLALTVFAIGFVCGCSESPVEEVEDEVINGLVDQILLMVKNLFKSKLEPFYLPDEDVTFHKKILFVKTKIELQLRNGQLRNLTSLHRDGDATGKNLPDGIVATVPLELNNLSVHYDIKAKWLKITKSFKANATVKRIAIKAQLSIKDGVPNFDSLQVQFIDTPKISLDGFGVLDGVGEAIAKKLVEKNKEKIISLIEHEIREAVNKEIHKKKFVFF